MPADKCCFTLQFCGTHEDVRHALQIIMGKVSTTGADQDFCGRVEIVLAEVLNNVVEHALCGQSPLQIEARCERRDNGWYFRISDPGRALPGDVLPHTQLPSLETDLAELPEGGFGWAMVHLLARDVNYARVAQGNRLRFVIPFAQTGPD